jgi:DNA polymerase III subunit gamma/tau
MAYLVLARKYRPQTFEDVVKQDHVTLTLKNAIASNRMAHAVLFSGPRGTGKTTVARILAKAMNCEKGPAPVPCNSCKSCHDITSSGAVDVYEIDGASNNGVEQVRELRDNIKYMPAHSRYKIYIIDEVHMLSTAAFNALLKTLEEPPAHVLFIFATTEPHKIPLTILSRCRRHDFRRISIDAITDHLETICKKENFDIEKESLDLMAREAGGCMRDALSLLDQVMTCSQGGVARDQILDVMGVIDRKLIFDMTDGILAANVPDILVVLDEIYDRGQDMKKLYSDLLEHFRNLLVVKLAKNLDKLVDVPKHELKMMVDQVSRVTASHIGQLFDILFREEPTVRFSAQPKMALEMALIRMCQIKPVLSIDEVIEKLDF